MLQYSTVESSTLALLKELMSIPELSNFYLVGGTNLSLRYGHRISIDLDLFSNIDFLPNEITTLLNSRFNSDKNSFRPTSIGVFANINGVKVDLIRNHNHPLIYDNELIDGIRFYDARDIAAMKIQAILRRGQKKDFYDVYELLNHFKIKEVIEFYNLKYPHQDLFITIPQALTYFEDADESEAPISLRNYNWDDVKNGLQKAVNDYLK
jgi:hypothetical protein